jgi:hypothetical protein
MVRNLIEDVVPPDRKSIRRIPVPNNRGRHITPKKENPEILEEEVARPAPRSATRPATRGGRFEIPRESRPTERSHGLSLPYEREQYEHEVPERRERVKREGGRSWWLWFIALASVVVLFVIFSLYFSGTKIELTPHEETAVLDAEFSAAKSNLTGLSYEVMTITKTGERSVPATGKEEVRRKASGQIIIYNNESAEQRLVKNTRFESPDGLIYRITSDITLPSAKTEAGKVVPSTLEATVYADQIGEKYNIPKADFTIPGFEGDPKFRTIYAKGKTAMSGGFDGQMNAVEDEVLENARIALRADLVKQALSDAKANKPVDVVLFESLVSPEYESSGETNSADGKSVMLHETAIVSVALLSTNTLSTAISQAVKASTTSVVDNLESLEAIPTTSLDGIDGGTFTFSLKGAPHLVSALDSEKIKQALLGKSRKSLFEVLATFPEIAKADVSFRPFWRSTFPTDPAKINVIIIIE